MRSLSSRFSHVLSLGVLVILGLGARLAPLVPDVLPPHVARAATRTVTSTNDSGPGSLRTALAGATAGDSIMFSLPPSSTITLSSTLDVTTSVTIDGSAASNLTVSGNNATRVFNVSAPSTITSLTIANGRATSSGGGLRATSPLTLTNVNIISNTTTVGGPIEGGGGLFAASALTLTNVNVISNTATNSAGGGIRASGPTTVSGGSFRGNRTISSGGG